MIRRTSPTFVGAFVLGALVLLVLALLVLGGGRFTGDWETLVLYFRSETTGLSVGAPVVLKGVQIGTVKKIQVAYDESSHQFLVPVYIEIDQDKVIWPKDIQGRLADPEVYKKALEQGLRAKLGLQSLLTGLLQVEIGFFPGTPAKLVGRDTRYREIPTIPSELERFRKELLSIPIAQIVEDLTQALKGIDQLVEAPELKRTLENLDRAAGDLAAASAEAHTLIGPTGKSLNGALNEFRDLAQRLGPKLESAADGLADASRRVAELAGRADSEARPLAERLKGTLDSAQGAFVSAGRALDRVAAVTDSRSPLYVESVETLRSLAAAADSLRHLADYLERHPESLIQGKR